MTQDEWAHDSPRLFTVEAVAEAARFLVATPFASLARHYDPEVLMSAEVYPEIWDQDWALSYLDDFYTRLAAFFAAAAADHEPILVWMA